MLNGYVTQSVTFHSNVRFLISLLRASSRKSRRCWRRSTRSSSSTRRRRRPRRHR